MAAAASVYECIVGVSREIAQTGIAKSRSNQQQNYKFRGIDEVLNALSPLLVKYRLVILPRVLSRSVVERATKSGGVLIYVTVEVAFDFVSTADGSTHTVVTYGEAMDSADKATNKALSAAYKYAALLTFCIPTEGDNDADAVTHEPVPTSPAVVAPPVVAPPVKPFAPAPSPAGYTAWLDTLHNAAVLGTAALEDAWRDASLGYRQHLTLTAPETKQTLKAIAARMVRVGRES